MSTQRKFFVATFGCRTNQADSAAIREDFVRGHFSETEECREADVIVVNSCTVTHRSDQQVRQLARHLRRENPSARILVTGCYAQRDPHRLARVEGVDAVVGNTRKNELLDILEELEDTAANPPGPQELAAIYRDSFQKMRAIDLVPATRLGGKTRPFVKLQDGCDARCTYCIIPSVRGPSRSVPPRQVLEQIGELVRLGFKEVVLTGIHIGTYGMHLQPRTSLDRLLAEIVEIPGLQRVRLSSIEPMNLSRRIIDLAAHSERVARHFHICLQSGSDRILRRMLRPYDRSRFASIVEEIRERLPDAAIGTDVIAGFPGESEEDHGETIEFLQRMPFTYVHVFPYSDRSGTRASTFIDKVPARELKRRKRELLRLSARKQREFRRRFLGEKLSVLTLAQEEDGMRTAISSNYIKTAVDRRLPANRILQALAVGEAGDRLILDTPLAAAPDLIPLTS